jgi:hypothetical protein
MDRKRVVGLALLATALAVGAKLALHLPREQVVHYVLGDAAAGVKEVDTRWSAENGGDDWTREASFRYAPGTAPRVVTHEPRLPDGDYTVEIELVEDSGHSLVRRRVTLGGGATSIDLASVRR